MTSSLKKSLAGITSSLALVVLSQHAHALLVDLDTFTVSKNNSVPVYFQDSFDDGSPPPTAPGEFQTYLYPRGTFVEANGRLTLNTATGVSAQNAAGVVSLVTRATFSSNIVDSDPASGLKSGHTFSVTGVFDLPANSAAGDVYGIRLTDRDALGNFGGPAGNDVLDLSVVHGQNGVRAVRFQRQDFLSGDIVRLDTQPIDAFIGNNDQIALTLYKDSLANVIQAKFSFVDNQQAGQPFLLSATPAIFQGETWTRAELFAAQVPEPEVYAMLLTGIGLVGWQLRRKGKRTRNRCLR